MDSICNACNEQIMDGGLSIFKEGVMSYDFHTECINKDPEGMLKSVIEQEIMRLVAEKMN